MFWSRDKITSCKPEMANNMWILNPFKKTHKMQLQCHWNCSVRTNGPLLYNLQCVKISRLARSLARICDEYEKAGLLCSGSENWWLKCVIFAIRLFTSTQKREIHLHSPNSFSQTFQPSLMELFRFQKQGWVIFVFFLVGICNKKLPTHSANPNTILKHTVDDIKNVLFWHLRHISPYTWSKGIIKKFLRPWRNYQNCYNCNVLFSTT